MTTRAVRGWPSDVLVPTLLGGTFYATAMQSLDVLAFDEVWSWGRAAVTGTAFAAVFGLAMAAQYRFTVRGRERAEVARVVASGVLPAGSDREWWGRLEAERRRLRSNGTGALAISVLGALLVAVVTPLRDGPGEWGWGLALALLLVGGVAVRHQRLRSAAVDRMHRGLQERLTSV
ncbi:hypothetical protein [Geodermatophilus sp. FMUSA9-8]|uniref:hypothetical protein n=1 Tax=Geodermatophilus sp. FMUSA9-8 TaxID=3120155 RepID=UPI003009BD78